MGCDNRFAFCRAVKQLGVASRDETYGRVVDGAGMTTVTTEGGEGRNVTGYERPLSTPTSPEP